VLIEATSGLLSTFDVTGSAPEGTAKTRPA
jgi:hypothetical protein